MPTLVAMPGRRAVAVARDVSHCIAAPASRAPTGAEVALTTQPFAGFGFVRYQQSAAAAPIALNPGVRTLLQLTLDPALTVGALRPPFAGRSFFDGTTLKTTAPNDVLTVRLAFTTTSTVSGGMLLGEAALVAGGAVLDTKSDQLANQAGTAKRVDFEMLLFAGASFVSSGVQFYLTSTVPLVVMNETLLVVPLSSGS